MRPAFNGRHGVVSACVPRVTAANPARAQQRPARHTVRRHRLRRVFRAGRVETAAVHAAQRRQNPQRREQNLICPNQGDNSASHVEAIAPADERSLSKSPSISRRDFPTMAERATIMASKLGFSLCLFSRHASRISRRARLRVTALPTLRLTEKPARVAARADSVPRCDPLSVARSRDSRTYKIRQRPSCRRPSNRNLRKSLPSRSRSALRKVAFGFPPDSLACPFLLMGRTDRNRPARARPARSDGAEPFATLAATAAQRGASSFGAGAFQEAKTPLPTSLRWMISWFHEAMSAAKKRLRSARTSYQLT